MQGIDLNKKVKNKQSLTIPSKTTNFIYSIVVTRIMIELYDTDHNGGKVYARPILGTMPELERRVNSISVVSVKEGSVNIKTSEERKRIALGIPALVLDCVDEFYKRTFNEEGEMIMERWHGEEITPISKYDYLTTKKMVAEYLGVDIKKVEKLMKNKTLRHNIKNCIAYFNLEHVNHVRGYLNEGKKIPKNNKKTGIKADRPKAFSSSSGHRRTDLESLL